jgi:RHS repeat-associated protein
MVVLRDAFHPRIDAIELGPRLARWIISGNVGLRKPASCILGDSDAEIWDGSSRLLTPSFNLELAGFWIQNSRHGSIDRVNYVFMVTSVTPSIEQYMPPAQARAEYRSAYVTLDPVAYLSSTTLVTQLAKQTHASPNVAITNGTDSYHRNHQYSVTAITTSTGAIAERYAYTAYGQPTILDPSGTVLQTSNFSLRYSFTGREWDATLGLHHFRARWLSGLTGRFLTRDPIGFNGGKNLYRN